MPDLNQAEIDEIVGKLAGGDEKSLAATLKEKAKKLYQQIFNEGHASAFGKQKSAVEAAEAKATEAEEKLEKLQEDFDNYKASKKDVAAVESEWTEKYRKLEKKFTDFKEQVKQDAITSRVSGVIERVKSVLKETIDDDKAETLVDRQSVRSRILSDDGKSLRILQPELQIPYAGDDDAQIAALAEELSKGVDAKFLKSDVDKGTGNKDSIPARGNEKPKAGAKKFGDIREKAKAARGKSEKTPDKQLDEAFGIG